MLVNKMEGESRIRILTTLGTTPVANKEHDSTCMISCVAGIVRRLKVTDERKGVLNMVRCLIRDADCVDKGVITEIIDLGTNYILDYENAIHVALESFSMMLEDSNMKRNHPNDTRVAFAIRTGVFEMYLGFIERFSEHVSFGIGGASMNVILTCIFRSMNNVSLHKKSTKAIKSKRSSIEDMLVRLEENTDITSNTEYKKLLDMIRVILDMNGSYCCRCNKSLSRTEVMECNGCHHMTYCSRACQREDWFNGHSLTCCKSYTNENSGQFQGRMWPVVLPNDERAATKVEELEKNISMIQLKLFLDNSETILSRAKEMNLPLHDCIVKFELYKFPIEIDVLHYTGYFNATETREGFEKSRSKKNITCSYISYIYNGVVVESGVAPNLQIQRLFPHQWLTNKKE